MTPDAQVERPPALRHPCWRWRIVEERFAKKELPDWGDACVDAYVGIALHHERLARNGRDRLAARMYPAVAAAVAAYRQARPRGLRWIIEAALCAPDGDAESVAEITGLNPEAVQSYAALFFDSDPGCAAAFVNAVIAPRLLGHNTEYDVGWKQVARRFGLDGVRAVVDALMGTPLPHGIAVWMEQRVRQGVLQDALWGQDADRARAAETVMRASVTPGVSTDRGSDTDGEVAMLILEKLGEELTRPDIEARVAATTDFVELGINPDFRADNALRQRLGIETSGGENADKESETGRNSDGD
jgi:hypothetical protein